MLNKILHFNSINSVNCEDITSIFLKNGLYFKKQYYTQLHCKNMLHIYITKIKKDNKLNNLKIINAFA